MKLFYRAILLYGLLDKINFKKFINFMYDNLFLALSYKIVNQVNKAVIDSGISRKVKALFNVIRSFYIK